MTKIKMPLFFDGIFFNKLKSMPGIKVIVFDLGNVLIPFDYNQVIDSFNKIESGLGISYAKTFENNIDFVKKYERWEVSDDEFIQQNLMWLHQKVSSEEFCKCFSEMFEVNEDTTALLPKLKNNYKLVLLSNTNHIHQKYGWGKYDFLKHFDKLILSHEVGAVKPEQKIYEAVTSFTKEPPESHVFIDDIKEYTEAAQTLGWKGIHFLSYHQLLNEFEKLSISVED